MTSRSPQELYELVSLVGECLPRLPSSGLFAIDEVLRQASLSHHNESVAWQWRDEHDVWRPYTATDARIIEAAYTQQEDECVLNTMGRTYVVDFNSMIQINEESGTARPVQRKTHLTTTSTTTPPPPTTANNNNNETIVNKNLSAASGSSGEEKSGECASLACDVRLEHMSKRAELYAQFVTSLFAIVFEVYNSSAAPSIKHKSLRTLIRLVYHSASIPRLDSKDNKDNDSKEKEARDLLATLLCHLPISSHIASMLASNDSKIVVSALQLAELCMQRLPDIFAVYFYREGVIFQIDKLIESAAPVVSPPPPLKLDAKPMPSEQQQPRTTRSLTAKTAAAAAAAVAAATEPSHSKRKTNAPQQQQQQQPQQASASQATSSGTSSSSSSSSAKYFRNIVAKMSSSSAAASTTASNTFAAPQSAAIAIPSSSSSSSSSSSRRKTSSATTSSALSTTAPAATSSSSPTATASASGKTAAPNASSSVGSRPLAAAAAAASANSASAIDLQLISQNKERVRQWIGHQARHFRATYFPPQAPPTPSSTQQQSHEQQQQQQQQQQQEEQSEQSKSAAPALDVLEKLRQPLATLATEQQQQQQHVASIQAALGQVGLILHDTDISAFEMIHSGLIERFLLFLANQPDNKSTRGAAALSVDTKVKLFLAAFVNLPLPDAAAANQDKNKAASSSSSSRGRFGALVLKLHNCVNQLEQFAVKVHDVPSSIGYGKTAIKFFNTHQLKFTLQRHESDAGSLRQWKGAHVKVDPLAIVATIEKYLLMRGIHKPATATPSTAPATQQTSSSSVPSSGLSRLGLFASSAAAAASSSANTQTATKPHKSQHKDAATTTAATTAAAAASSSSSKFFLLKAAADLATDRLSKAASKSTKPFAARFGLGAGSGKSTAASATAATTTTTVTTKTTPSSRTSQRTAAAAAATTKEKKSTKTTATSTKTTAATATTKTTTTKKAASASKSALSSKRSTTAASSTKKQQKAGKAASSSLVDGDDDNDQMTSTTTTTTATTSALVRDDQDEEEFVEHDDHDDDDDDREEEEEAVEDDEDDEDDAAKYAVEGGDEEVDDEEYELYDAQDEEDDDDEMHQEMQNEDDEEDEHHVDAEEEEEEEEDEEEGEEETYDDDEEDVEEEDEDDEFDDDDDDDDDDEEDEIESAMSAILARAGASTTSSATSAAALAAPGGGGTMRSVSTSVDSSGAATANLHAKHFFSTSKSTTTAAAATTATTTATAAAAAAANATRASSSSLLAFGGQQPQQQALPRIELLINGHVLPSHMTIYQALKQFGPSDESAANQQQCVPSGQAQDSEAETTANAQGTNAIWTKIHAITYRTASSSSSSSSPSPSPSATTATRRQSSKSASISGVGSDETPTTSNNNNAAMCCNARALRSFLSSLSSDLPQQQQQQQQQQQVNDRSMKAIGLLRLLNAISRHWHLLYSPDEYDIASLLLADSADPTATTALATPSDFVNVKLTSKANRQLQDPLVIMTGHLPGWLPALMHSCAFLFPFETRLMYFYVSALDRDRAMHKLIELSAELAAAASAYHADSTLNAMASSGSASAASHHHHSERFVPKLERRKRTVRRAADLLRQTEAILNEFAPASDSSTSSHASSSAISAATSTLLSLFAAGTGHHHHHHHHQSQSSPFKPAMLEIQYENEVGTGLGPTLEFYALVSLEMQKCEHEMWRGDKVARASPLLNHVDSTTSKTTTAAAAADSSCLFYFSPSGLFPAPVQQSNQSSPASSKHQQTLLVKVQHKFKLLGKFAAKAVMDFRVMDIPLSAAFYKCLLDPEAVCADDMRHVDAQLHASMQSLQALVREASGARARGDQRKLSELEAAVVHMDLDFTLPGYAHIELKRGGRETLVTLASLADYLTLLAEWTLRRGIQAQMDAFVEGFEAILPLAHVRRCFAQPDELERLFCGAGFSAWDKRTLAECTRCDHGYTHESQAVQYLFEIMCSFDADEQRRFLQFVTGSPRLPVGGLRALVPPLTIVRKTSGAADSTPVPQHSASAIISPAAAAAASTATATAARHIAETYLPSVMTCVNYLKLPDYSSVELMRSKLMSAMMDGQLSFHLS